MLRREQRRRAVQRGECGACASVAASLAAATVAATALAAATLATATLAAFTATTAFDTWRVDV